MPSATHLTPHVLSASTRTKGPHLPESIAPPLAPTAWHDCVATWMFCSERMSHFDSSMLHRALSTHPRTDARTRCPESGGADMETGPSNDVHVLHLGTLEWVRASSHCSPHHACVRCTRCPSNPPFTHPCAHPHHPSRSHDRVHCSAREMFLRHGTKRVQQRLRTAVAWLCLVALLKTRTSTTRTCLTCHLVSHTLRGQRRRRKEHRRHLERFTTPL